MLAQNGARVLFLGCVCFAIVRSGKNDVDISITSAGACIVAAAFSITGLSATSAVPSCVHGATDDAHCSARDVLRPTQCARGCELVGGGHTDCGREPRESALEALSSTDGVSTVAHLMRHLLTARTVADGTQRASVNGEEVCFDVVEGTAPCKGCSSAHATTFRRMLCVDRAHEDFWAELTWVSLARAGGTSAVAPAVHFPATLRDVQPTSPDGDDASVRSDETIHSEEMRKRGQGCIHNVQVIVSLGRGGEEHVMSMASSLDTTTTKLLWAGPLYAVAKLALPNWLRPVSMEQRLLDGDTWCIQSSTEENSFVVVISAPRQSVPPSLLRISEALDRYDAAVTAASFGPASPSPSSTSSSSSSLILSSSSLRTSAFSFGGTTSDATYGELTDEGAARLFVRIGLGRHDVFYDLGSGDGKV